VEHEDIQEEDVENLVEKAMGEPLGEL